MPGLSIDARGPNAQGEERELILSQEELLDTTDVYKGARRV